jgi:hypothetical protein
MTPAVGAATGFRAEDGQGIPFLILSQCEHLRFDFFRLYRLCFSCTRKGPMRRKKQTESKPDQLPVSIL